MILQHPVVRQAGRFLATGVFATLIHTATVLVFVALWVPTPSQVTANGVAFVVANVFSYVVNSLWSFSAPLHGMRFLRFLTVSGLGFLGTLVMAYVAELSGLNPLEGVVLVVCTMTPVSFVLHRRWTFRGAQG